MNAEGEPKLLDFGIAKSLELEEGASDLTTSGRQHLTPQFASPEQARGDAVTVASDVYALGAILFEILTGSTPYRFSKAHPSREELLRVVCKEEPPLPSLVSLSPEARRELSGDLDLIVLHALRKEPAGRYGSTAAFAEDIRRHLSGTRVQLLATATADGPQQRGAGHRLLTRRYLAAAAILIGLGAGVGTFVLSVTKNRRTTTPGKVHSSGESPTSMPNSPP